MPDSTSDKVRESDLDGPQHRVMAAAESLDDLRQKVLELSADDRLRLVVQLWKSLPAEHRSALATLQMEDTARPENQLLPAPKAAEKKPRGPTLIDNLFDPSHTSDLYTAPRRFDLATIFVVTAACSLVLGGLTVMGWPPIVKVVVSILAAAIAVTQAMFKTTANPRGVSVVTGAAVSTLIIWVAYAAGAYRVLRTPLPVATLFFGLIGGSISGYLVGTCVGGVFLVADMVRGKFEQREPSNVGEGELTNDSDIQGLDSAIRENRYGDE